MMGTFQPGTRHAVLVDILNFLENHCVIQGRLNSSLKDQGGLADMAFPC